MGGFPNRPDLASLGPTLVDTAPVLNPSKEATSAQYNLLRWQAAGIGLLSYRAWLIFTANSGSQPILLRAEAWNPKGLTTGANAPPVITRIGTGNYNVVYPTQVPDQANELTSLAFVHGVGQVVTPSQTTFRKVMVTPLSGSPSGVKVMVLDAAGSAVDGHDVSILIG
jgi:hypothetical protein